MSLWIVDVAGALLLGASACYMVTIDAPATHVAVTAWCSGVYAGYLVHQVAVRDE